MNEKKKIESRVNECLRLMPGWKIEIKYLPESTDLECVVFSKNGKTFRRKLAFILDNSPRFIKNLIESYYRKNTFD